MNDHLLLVGFMGAGKSTVATLVAERLGRPCVDLDGVIERAAGRSITELFADEGEESFRARETSALEALSKHASAVVACGGGVVLRPRNRTLLKQLGTVVYLVVTAEEAVARVGDLSSRPLLAGPGGALAATQLLSARESLYRCAADAIVDTEGLDTGEVADSVLRAIGERDR